MNAKIILRWILKLAFLLLLYIPIWILGAFAMGDLIPEVQSEPGLLDEDIAFLLLGILNTLLIVGLILTSRWNGWRLVLILAFAYYGSFTLLTQIESWYFLSETTIPPILLPRLFLMGITIPFLFIPLAVFICGKWKKNNDTVYPRIRIEFSPKQLAAKFAIIAVIYLIIYWLAGYFIAWQNPDLRAFYGSPGEIKPFFTHALDTFLNTPSLIALQLFRGIIFAFIAFSIMIGSTTDLVRTAVFVALLFALPPLVHILPNPLMPNASIRMSHLVETASSNFMFGLIVVWLFRKRPSSLPYSFEFHSIPINDYNKSS